MSKTLKIVLLSLLIVGLVGFAYIAGRGSGGGLIQRTVPFSITVNAAGAYEITITPADAVVTKGDPLVFTITAIPSGGFDAQIGLTISGLPATSFALGNATLAPGAWTTNLTVNTNLLNANSVYTCNVNAEDK